MKVGNFGVYVTEGNETDDGYVKLDHGKNYTITLENFYLDRSADAEVKIDGKSIATYRLYAGQVWKIERSPEDNGKFTFYIAGTNDSEKAGIEIGNSSNGLIEVYFTPEKYKDKIRVYSNVTGTYAAKPFVKYSEYHTTDGFEDSLIKASSSTWTTTEAQLTGLRSKKLTSYAEGATGLSGHSNQRFSSAEKIDRDEDKTVVVNLRLVGVKNEPRPLKGTTPVLSNPVPPPLYKSA